MTTRGARSFGVGAAPFVGRDHVLDELAAWWSRATSSPSVEVVVVSGASGVGKTRLVEEFIARLPASVRVLAGRSGRPVRLPFEPWVAALRVGLAEAGAPLESLDEACRRQMAAVPWLRDLVPGTPATPVDVVDERAVFAAVRTVLGNLARHDPVVVVLDDVHWADQGSVRLLGSLVDAPLGSCAVVVVERVPGDRNSAWQALRDRHRFARYVIQRLTPDEIESLVGTAFPGHDPTAFAAELAEVSGGNAFVATSLIDLAARSAAAPDDVVARLPRSARAIWAARLAELDPATRRLLAAAAAAGDRCDTRWLEVVAPEHTELAGELGRAVECGVLEWVDGGSAVTFGHDLLREHLYGTLTATRRRRVHRALATAMEAAAEPGPSPRSAVLAHHWARSGLGGHRSAIVHHLDAARWALAQGATLDARHHAEEALSLLSGPEDGSGASPNGGSDHADDALVFDLGDLLLRVGHPEGERLLREMAVRCERDGDVTALARIADSLLRARQPLGEPTEAVDFAFGLIGRLEGVEPSLHSRVLARLVRAREGRADAGEIEAALSAKALRLARESGDPTSVALALFCHRAHHPWTDERFDLCREQVALGRQVGDPLILVLGLLGLHTTALDRGDGETARSALAEAVELAATLPVGHTGEIHNHDPAPMVLASRLRQAQLSGTLDERDRLIHELAGHGVESGLELDRMNTTVLVQTALLAHDRGRLDDIADVVAVFARERPDSAQRAVGAARVLAGCGRLDEARGFYDLVVTDGRTAVPDDQATAFVLIMLAETAVLLDDVAGAAVVESRLARFAGRGSCFLGGSQGPVDLALARCALLRDDALAALELAGAAVDLCDRVGMPGFGLRARLFRAQVLDRLGERSAAVSEARWVLDGAGTAGMLGIVEEAEALLAG